jgi:hypothetical protein
MDGRLQFDCFVCSLEWVSDGKIANLLTTTRTKVTLHCSLLTIPAHRSIISLSNPENIRVLIINFIFVWPVRPVRPVRRLLLNNKIGGYKEHPGKHNAKNNPRSHSCESFRQILNFYVSRSLEF